MQASLAAKGFPIGPLRIVELGLAENGEDPILSLMLPCRLNIYAEGGRVVIAALRPSVFLEIYPERNLEQAARDLENAVMAVVDEVSVETP